MIARQTEGKKESRERREWEWKERMGVVTSAPSTSVHRPQLTAINPHVKIYRKTRLASPVEGWKRGAIGFSSFHSLSDWVNSCGAQNREGGIGRVRGEEEEKGGGRLTLHDLAPQKKKEKTEQSRLRVQKWRRLRRKRCARQTLPTVELKCYCKVTCKVPERRPLTPTFCRLTSNGCSPVSLDKGVTQQPCLWLPQTYRTPAWEHHITTWSVKAVQSHQT